MLKRSLSFINGMTFGVNVALSFALGILYWAIATETTKKETAK